MSRSSRANRLQAAALSGGPIRSGQRRSAGNSASRQNRSKVKRNAQGGVYVDPSELKAAFDFFDSSGKGYLTKSDLSNRLPVFYQGLKPKEYQYLMNKQNQLTYSDLYDMLVDNDLKDFDPVYEAFQFYDPEGKGFIEPSTLGRVLTDLGLGPVSEDDLVVLAQVSDVDGDGHIGLEDFRQMLNLHTRAADDSDTEQQQQQQQQQQPQQQSDEKG